MGSGLEFIAHSCDKFMSYRSAVTLDVFPSRNIIDSADKLSGIVHNAQDRAKVSRCEVQAVARFSAISKVIY